VALIRAVIADIEKPLKIDVTASAPWQQLMLRGSVDFANVDECRRFLAAMLERLNAGRRQRLAEEMAVMRELPERRMESARRESGQGAPCPVGPRR
jgi:hypothetical protein